MTSTDLATYCRYLTYTNSNAFPYAQIQLAGRTVSNLSEFQSKRMEVFIEHLSAFPLPELIHFKGRLTTPDIRSPKGMTRHRQHVAGSFAASRIGFYMDTLRSLEAERVRIGYETFVSHKAYKRLVGGDPIEAETARRAVVSGVGFQDITFHFWTICVAKISRLLELAEKHSGYKIPSADWSILESYRPLRNFYEHVETEMPGSKGRSGAVTEIEDDESWLVRVGFETDGSGRILVAGEAVDVTSRGLASVEDVVRRSEEGMRKSLLMIVRSYLASRPDRIPSPVDVPLIPVVKVSVD